MLFSSDLSSSFRVVSVNNDGSDYLVEGAIYNFIMEMADTLGHPIARDTNFHIEYDK